MFLLWLKFIIASAIVVFSGYRICIYAEKIARITRIGRTFIGLILLAVVTSLPELAVTLSATKIGALDLALGDLFGSNLFNLTIVGVIFLYSIRKPELLAFSPTHFISAGFSILLISLAAVDIVCHKLFFPYVEYSPLLLDVETALILLTYLFGAYLIFRIERGPSLQAKEESLAQMRAGGVWFRFILWAVLLVGFAVYLAHLGDEIARIPVRGVALGGTFVGSLFIAITTSLPELAVAFSAVKLGFLDMALGNILGSNMFNMFIISITDLFLGRQTILSSASALHLFTILFVLISTALVISGLVYRSRRKTPALAWDSASIIFVYFVANLVNFYLR